MITTRPATIEEVRGAHPDHSCSYKAWAVEMDGNVVGLIGLALTRPEACLFCSIDAALRPHLTSMTVMRLVKHVAGVIERHRTPVLAIRDRKEPKAARLLKRLGFRFDQLVDGEAVYRRGC